MLMKKAANYVSMQDKMQSDDFLALDSVRAVNAVDDGEEHEDMEWNPPKVTPSLVYSKPAQQMAPAPRSSKMLNAPPLPPSPDDTIVASAISKQSLSDMAKRNRPSRAIMSPEDEQQVPKCVFFFLLVGAFVLMEFQMGHLMLSSRTCLMQAMRNMRVESAVLSSTGKQGSTGKGIKASDLVKSAAQARTQSFLTVQWRPAWFLSFVCISNVAFYPGGGQSSCRRIACSACHTAG